MTPPSIGRRALVPGLLLLLLSSPVAAASPTVLGVQVPDVAPAALPSVGGLPPLKDLACESVDLTTPAGPASLSVCPVHPLHLPPPCVPVTVETKPHENVSVDPGCLGLPALPVLPGMERCDEPDSMAPRYPPPPPPCCEDPSCCSHGDTGCVAASYVIMARKRIGQELGEHGFCLEVWQEPNGTPRVWLHHTSCGRAGPPPNGR